MVIARLFLEEDVLSGLCLKICWRGIKKKKKNRMVEASMASHCSYLSKNRLVVVVLSQCCHGKTEISSLNLLHTWVSYSHHIQAAV